MLSEEGFVAIYGSFKVDGAYTTESNAASRLLLSDSLQLSHFFGRERQNVAPFDA